MALVHSRGALSALLLFIAALGAMALLAYLPFVQLAGVESQIELRDGQLRRLQARVLRAARTAAATTAGPGLQVNSSAGSLIPTAASGLAGARLQKLLVTMARDNRGEVSSVQVLPLEADGDLQKITVAIAVRIDIKGLRDLLYEMETRSPLLFIETFSLRKDLSGRRRGREQRSLIVMLKVGGFMRNELQS